MNVSFRQLRVFQAVAHHLSHTRASEELNLTQPAVSMQIRLLEDEVGIPLFEKLGKQICLTEAGRELYQYSRTIFAELEEAEAVLQSLRGLNRGTLNIAVASTVNYFAPRLLAVFHRRFPGIRLTLEVTNRQSLIRLLQSNEVDLVLMGQPPEQLDLDAEPFMDNPLVVIAPPNHPLVGERQIPLERLAKETFVIREPGSGTRAAMERYFADRGVKLQTGMQMTRNEAIKQAVRAGLGLSLVSGLTIELELETARLAVLDVEGFPLRRRWYLMHRQGKRLSPAAAAFRDFLLQGDFRDLLGPEEAKLLALAIAAEEGRASAGT